MVDLKSPPVGTDPVTMDVQQEALDHVWIHSQPWAELAERQGLRVFERGEGTRLWDSTGREYFDGISGLWVVNAGHGRTEIGEAMGRQAGKLAYVSAASVTNGPAVELAHTIASLTPGDLNRVFFSSGGSEAVETALKIAKQIQAMRGFPRRYKVIARRGSYHGMTHGAMSLTAQRNETYFGPFMYGVSHVPHPNQYRSDFGLEGEAADIMAARYVEQEIENQGPETVACVIGEPISSAAGLHVPSKAYWQMLREICDRHGVLLICDEVINGFGRTGTMFAIEKYGIVPDIITMAKALSSGYAPIAATVVRDSVYDIFKDQKDVSMGHLLTFGGHAVASVAALKNLEIYEREGLVQRSAELGDYLLEKLNGLRHHRSVGDVRGVGLFAVLDLVSSKETRKSMAKDSAFTQRLNVEIEKRGLLTRAWQVMHFAPPLVVTREEIDHIVGIADESLTIAEREHPESFDD
ncbi:MAG TPA: aspartate aminotransferase family protein [Thermomicrobiales bacterium]|jgi:adenosylmethionine-8-amino-7-oxononanoate aminotransferase|nr:aspartate aminotransferase family protein [Thermomicrobiales bacterium]